jgi:hypothetical protein
VPTNICDSCQRLEEERWRWNPWPWLTFVKQKQTSARIQCDGKQQADTCQRTLCTPCRFPPLFFLERCCSFLRCPFAMTTSGCPPIVGGISMYFMCPSFVVLPTVVGRLSRRRFCFCASQMGVCSVLSPGTPTYCTAALQKNQYNRRRVPLFTVSYRYVSLFYPLKA